MIYNAQHCGEGVDVIAAMIYQYFKIYSFIVLQYIMIYSFTIHNS